MSSLLRFIVAPLLLIVSVLHHLIIVSLFDCRIVSLLCLHIVSQPHFHFASLLLQMLSILHLGVISLFELRVVFCSQFLLDFLLLFEHLLRKLFQNPLLFLSCLIAVRPGLKDADETFTVAQIHNRLPRGGSFGAILPLDKIKEMGSYAFLIKNSFDLELLVVCVHVVGWVG